MSPGSMQAQSKPVLWGLNPYPTPTPSQATGILSGVVTQAPLPVSPQPESKPEDSGTGRFWKMQRHPHIAGACSIIDVGLHSATTGSFFLALASCFPGLTADIFPALYPLLPNDQGGLGCTQTQYSGILGRFVVVVDFFFLVLRMELGAHRTQELVHGRQRLYH